MHLNQTGTLGPRLEIKMKPRSLNSACSHNTTMNIRSHWMINEIEKKKKHLSDTQNCNILCKFSVCPQICDFN